MQKLCRHRGANPEDERSFGTDRLGDLRRAVHDVCWLLDRGYGIASATELAGDRRPLHLCPVCLRKLQFSVGFEVGRRYRDLARIDSEAGFADEVRWIERRLAEMQPAGR